VTMHTLLYERLPVLAAALWWGSLSVVGFMVVPLLFAHLPSPALAGFMAARLFAAQTWVSLACAALLLVLARAQEALPGVQSALGFVLGGLLLALLVQYGVSPRILARDNLRLWHGVGSAMYALQWLCALVVLWQASRAAIKAGSV